MANSQDKPQNQQQSQQQNQAQGQQQSRMPNRQQSQPRSALQSRQPGCSRIQQPNHGQSHPQNHFRSQPGRHLAKLFLVLILITAFVGYGYQKLRKDPITKSDFLLNTFVSVTIYDSQDERLLDGCMELCREYERIFSRTIENSEVSRLNNRKPGENKVQVSPAAAELIQKGLEYSALSGGAFDITIEPVSSLWDFSGGSQAVPDEEALKKGASLVDYRQAAVEGNCVIFSSPDTRIELGAIAKGYIADKIKEYLAGKGVKSALINLGGNVLCIGERPDKTPFKIGLQKPFQDRRETAAILSIADQSVVTSGIYERCFERDGKFYHHILNPADGFPYDNGLLSVTIVSPCSADGDALSTVCFSLGLEKGMALINRIPQTYAYFITKDYQIHCSNGAEALLESLPAGADGQEDAPSELSQRNFADPPISPGNSFTFFQLYTTMKKV